MDNRYTRTDYKEFHILTRIAMTGVAFQKDIWDTEEKNGGYLVPYMKGVITKTLNILRRFKEAVDIPNIDEDKLLIKIVSNNSIQYYANNVSKKHIMLAKEEGKYLPKGMADTWITSLASLHYMMAVCKDVLKEENLIDDLNRLVVQWSTYCKMFINELFILDDNDVSRIIKQADSYNFSGIPLTEDDEKELLQRKIGTDFTVDGKCVEGCCECCTLGVYFDTETLRKLRGVLKPHHLKKYETGNENEWHRCPFIIDSKCSIYTLPFKPEICKVYSCNADIIKANMDKLKQSDAKGFKRTKGMMDLLPQEIRDRISESDKVKFILGRKGIDG